MVEPLNVAKATVKGLGAVHGAASKTGSAVSGAGSAALNGLGAVSGANRFKIPGMAVSQDNVIFALLLLAFIIWITSKGELPIYIAFFKPGASQGPTPVPVTATSSTGASTTPGAIPGTVQSTATPTSLGNITNTSFPQYIQNIWNSTGVPSIVNGIKSLGSIF